MKLFLTTIVVCLFTCGIQAQVHTVDIDSTGYVCWNADSGITRSAAKIFKIGDCSGTGDGTLNLGAMNVYLNSGFTASPFYQIEGITSTLGPGPFNGNPNTPVGWYQSLVPGGKGAEAGQFNLSIPSGYTGGSTIGEQVDALSSNLWMQDASHYALAFQSFAVCDALGAMCWGANPVVTTYGGNPTHTGQQLHGIEVDCETNTTGVVIQCIQAGAPSSAQNPALANAFDIAKPAWPNGNWSAGLNIETGATGANPGIFLAPQDYGNYHNSQTLVMESMAGGVAMYGAIMLDTNGDVLMNPASGGFIRNATPGSGLQLLSSAGNFSQITNTATGFRAINFPDASGAVLVSGNGKSPIQSKRVAGCSTGGSSPFSSACNTIVSWTSAFPDANYTPTCTGLGINSGIPLLQAIVGITASSITVQTQQLGSTSAAFANISCIAVHD